MTTTDAPRYIAPDTYTGRWSRTPGKYRVDTYTAGELATLSVTVIWDSFGHISGVEHFGRTRVLADADGNLHCYAADGHKVSVHPADRELRILTK